MATREKSFEYYMSLPYTVEVRKTDEGYFAKVLELDGCMTWADTFEELGAMIEDAKAAWISDALEDGDEIPEPKDTEGYSGRLNLRLPKSLHRDLARRAAEESVSLNQLMVSELARAVGR
jgi:antitoxin HicB